MPLGLEPNHGVKQAGNLLPLAHVLAVNELNNWWSTSIKYNPLEDHLGLAFAHIELQGRYPLVLSPDSM
jgi:hypothetical protein